MTQDFMNSIVSGLVSGLMVAIIILVLQVYYQKVILPWIEERVYKGVKIEGEWVGEISKENFSFNLRRISHRVNGEMVRQKDGQVYKLDGEFRNLILTVTYTSSASRAIDRGCFTFLLVDNGRELNGYAIYYYSPHHKVHSQHVEFRRV